MDAGCGTCIQLDMSNHLDEKIVKKKSIPAQIVFWLFVLVALFAFYKAFSGHPGH